MNHSTFQSTISAGQAITPRRAVNRRPFDGPAVADLAEVSTPAIARMDVGRAAQVVAGYAYDAADLVSLLRILGILEAPPRWRQP